MNRSELSQDEQLILDKFISYHYAIQIWTVWNELKGKKPSFPTAMRITKQLVEDGFLKKRQVRGRIYYSPSRCYSWTLTNR
jgi:DNA-binding PadR family transcriptional regulator